MTICVLQGDTVINVGPWDYQAVEIMSMGELESTPPLIQDGFAIYNPLPAGAVHADVDLAWTADEKIVLASSALAVRSFE